VLIKERYWHIIKMIFIFRTHPKASSKKHVKSESKNGLEKFMKNPLKRDTKSKLSCSVELSLKVF